VNENVEPASKGTGNIDIRTSTAGR